MDWQRVRRPGTYALAGVLIALLGFFPFVRGGRVPILGFVDLAVHEAGHVFFLWAPTDVMLAMGNGFQALMPLVVAGAFILQHRDLAGGAVGLAWCASALQDASIYIADAPVRRLPLLGPEDSHDWWQLLGAHGMLDKADELSRIVLFLAIVVYVLALGVLWAGLHWDAAWRAAPAWSRAWPWNLADPGAEPVRLRSSGSTQRR